MELNQLQNGLLQKQRLVVNITAGLKNVNSHMINLLRYCKMTDASFRAVHPEKLVVNFNKNLESSGKYRDSFYSVVNFWSLIAWTLVNSDESRFLQSCLYYLSNVLKAWFGTVPDFLGGSQNRLSGGGVPPNHVYNIYGMY